MLIDYREYDRQFYNTELKEFLPDKLIDIHAHVWVKEVEKRAYEKSGRVAGWISLVAQENSMQDLEETYRVLLPGKQVNALVFPNVSDAIDIRPANDYVLEQTRETENRALALVHPSDDAGVIRGYFSQGFKGIKVYLNYAPAYIPAGEIRISDYLPRHQLEEVNRQKGICMLHIPRSRRLRDPVNLAQMVEIEEAYPDIRLIIAHIGRAYAVEDIGNAMDVLKNTTHMLFDFSANTNGDVMAQLIRAVGPGRILLGTDLPIFRMRAHRIVENGVYYNVVPKGLYGDLSGEPNMRETESAENITFLMYEQIAAFRQAAEKTGLSGEDVNAVFYGNAAKLLYSQCPGSIK